MMDINRKLDEELVSPITGEVNQMYAESFGENMPERAKNISKKLGTNVETSILAEYLKIEQNDKERI